MYKDHRNRPDFDKGKKGSIFGVLLILFGGALILNNLDLIPDELHKIVFSWPMILVVIGSLLAFVKDDRTTGFTLMLIGGVFLLPRMFDWHYDLYRFFGR